MGRTTPVSRAGLSLVAVGTSSFDAPIREPGDPPIQFSNEDSNFEQYLAEIVGTAIQVGEGKLATCAHVIEAVAEKKRQGYLLTRSRTENDYECTSWPFRNTLRYVDPRNGKANVSVDLAIILAFYPGIPPRYDVPIARWGDSTKLGVGDPIVIGGYPYGTDLFRSTQTNRGIIQPTFYPGIVSAILPATGPTETRLLQISALAAGGISGGAVLDPISGKVLGMVTSGLEENGAMQPVTYAIPSEVIAPFSSNINFEAAGRRIGKEAPLGVNGRPAKEK